MDKKKKRYSLYSNFIYVLKKQWKYNKYSVLIQFVRIVSGVCMALVGVWVPKIVLDSLEQNVSVDYFLISFIPIVFLLALFTFFNHISNISMNSYANCMRYDCYVKEINDLAIKQEYSVYTSPEGKILRQKAEAAVGDSGYTGMNSFFTNITELGKNALGLISYSTILLWVNPLIIIFLIGSYVIDAIMSNYIQKWIHKNKDKRAVIKRKLNYMAYRTRALSAAKEIRMYDMADWLSLHGSEVINDATVMYNDIANKRYGRTIVEHILNLLKNGVAYGYLIYLLLQGDISIGDFMAYFAIIAGYGDWLKGIVELVSAIVEANYYVVDYREYVDSSNKSITEDKLSLEGVKYPYKIKFENVCYTYPGSDKTILENINFEISSGEKIALVGHNGAGKTTLIKLMCGLIHPTSGRVLLNGVDVKNIINSDYYKLFSAIFQDISLLPASIAKNIALSVEEKIDEDRVWECLRIAGLEKKIKSLPLGTETNLIKNISDNGVDLSKGEVQKLLLARAIYKESEILILDEPTSALDPIAESEVYEKYKEIVGNKMSIFISHRLSSTRFCDNIIFLKGKKIAEYGTHEELIGRNGEYARLFNLQSQYYNSNSFDGEVVEC